MKWNIHTPTGHIVHVDIDAAELVELTNAGIGLHQHFVSAGDLEITGGAQASPAWPQLQADVKQILERTTHMSDALDRITADVAAVGTAVSGVADAVRNHPAAASDDGQLNALADQLETAATTLSSISTSINNPGGTASVGTTATTTPTNDPIQGGGDPAAVDPAAVDPGAAPTDGTAVVDPNAPTG